MNQLHTDKMAKEKSSKGTELISPEKIKKEPEDVTPVSAAKSTSVSKTITVLTSPPGSTKASTTQPKTILLVQTVNSRTGGIQSLLLPQGLRSLPTTTSDMTLSASRAKMSTLLTVTSSAGKSPLSIVPKMTESLLTSSTGLVGKPATPQVQAQNDIKSVVKLSSAVVPSVLPKVCELTFNSRTIKADGTVCTLKEYLCNFCQYKVASQPEFHEHFMTHVFSCNYCSFRAFTRYEVLSHKKEKHQGIAEELAGYEGLDGFSEQMNSLIADFHCQTPVSTQMLVVSTRVSSAGESTTTTDSESASMVIVSSRPATTTSSCVPTVRTFTSASPIVVSSCLLSSPSSLVSVSRSVTLSTPVLQTSQPVVTTVSAPIVSTPFIAQKKMPIVTSATSSPAILPGSTVKTTASVGKANDNYFTYKIVHDAAGKVQAYECDVCSYRSTKINEIFGHASTHSLTDLMKSNNVNVQWECFYCCFTSVLQANVVSHVIAKHPNKPIQLKRMVTNTTQRSTSRSVLLRSTNFPTDAGSVAKATPSPPIKKEKSPEETPTSAAAATATGKKPDEADDGCMWGCYYCSVQSVDRNEIILHLKKDHAQQKLVITRRRITHIPAPHASKIDGNPEATELSSDLVPNDGEVVPSERTNSDVQIGDIDSTDPQHSLLKSRRKQVFPRKVFDDATNEEAGDSSKVTEVTDTTILGNKSKHRVMKSKDPTEQTDLKQGDGTTNKRQRKSEESAKRIKYDNSTGKDAPKMLDAMIIEANGTEDDADASTAMIVIDGQDGAEDTGMPALEDVSNFVSLKSAHGKVSTPQMSLANEPTGQVAVMTCPVNEVTPEPDKEMPVLHPELSVPVQVDGKFSNQQDPANGGKEKDNAALMDLNFVKDWPDDITVVDSKLFRFDTTTLEAHCNCCNLTTQGLNARNHMREHVMSHTGGHLWTCPYCPFKCGRRSMIFRHVQNKHKNRPLRLIQRKVYTKSSKDGTAAGFHSGTSDSSKTELSSVGFQGMLRVHSVLTKLKGPRTVKERSIIRTSTHMWQCPFCGRRNVFKGALKIHLKVAHPNKDSKTKLKRLTRPPENQTKKPTCVPGIVDIVPIEDMHLYETLSTLLLDNGVSLIHDLDIDDEGDDVEITPAVNRNAGSQKYRCTHCRFRNSNPKTVKSHVLQMHPGEMVIINDHRASRRTYHLFMCVNPECSFSTNRQELLTAHCCKGVTQVTDKAEVPSNTDEKLQSNAEPQPSCDILARPRIQSKSQTNLDSDSILSQSDPPKSVDTVVPGIENRQETSYAAGNLRKRLKTPEGPIDYNDDGTLKGVELEHGSVVLQCRYCDYPKTSDPVEIKDHLASKHPRLKPIAIDVDAKEKGGLACLFVCSVFGCDYSSHYSNVFEHHMNLEHPDVESNRLVKKKRTHKRTSSDKARIQNDLSNLSDKNESDFCKEAAIEETSAVGASSKSSDDKDIPPTVTLSSPATSTFSQPALSPVGTVASDVSNAFGDSPALGSPDDLSNTDASVKETKLPKKPRSKPRESFDYPVRFECVQCSFRIGSLEEMKSHLVAKHRDNFRNFYCIDRRARELRKRQKVLFCHDEHCSFYCKFEEELESHEKYNCTFAGGMRHHPKTTQDGVLQYMESVVKVNPSCVTNDASKLYQVNSSRGTMGDVNNKMYQCSHCTFITTDLHNIRMHVIAEHAATEGGFAEIKTELGTDGNIVMNVNDRGVRELGSKSGLNVNIGCEKNVIRESRSMYDAVDTVKIDDEEKVYTVL